MTPFYKGLCLFAVLALGHTSCTQPPTTAGQVPQSQTEGGRAKANGTPKPYSQVISREAVSDSGLFVVHKVADKYYYEIPDSLLQRDFLWISRIANLPSGLGGGYVNAGTATNEQVVVWERFENKLLLKTKSYNAYAADSLPIYLSVQANNYQPTLYAFDIAAFSRDSAGYVIEVSKFFQSDIKAISGLDARMRRDYKVSKLDPDRSFVRSIRSFPLNIEVKQEFTYEAAEPPSNSETGTISLVMNQSMVLLPKVPMKPRLNDYRVGYFTVRQIDYGSEALKSDEKTYIRRWRLEPKDLEAYKRGELVEPKKPIVYYLDPATPAKLRPYIKAGVEQWQKVFETAGFKNAILAKDPPTPEEDPDFSPEDVRYSVIRYVASTTRNAMGPSVSDPRSGEIIESDIVWYHNHLRSYRNRYLLETGAANPSARSLATPDEEIGEMMLEVISHEVGHALGLPHNMKASHAYATDSLRSGAFTQQWGIAASIMDYARYNYVAQEGDKGVRFVRQMGPYDHYSINWGYRLIPEARTPQEEVPVLSRWIEERAGDPRYQFGSGAGGYDPASQTEGIGDDALKASTYGLTNLKKVAPQLMAWTAAQTNEYDDLEELYGELMGVWSRYIGHVLTNVGGVHENRLRPQQEGYIYTPVEAKLQRQSLEWLLSNVFSSPDWLNQAQIVRNIHHASHLENMRSLQVRHLNNLLSFDRLARLMENEVKGVDYTALGMVKQLQQGIWSEVSKGQKIDIYRRNLQKAYLDRMDYLLNDAEAQQAAARSVRGYSTAVTVSQSDIKSIVRGELSRLESQLRSARGRYSDELSRYHIDDSLVRIRAILERERLKG
ncbi:zinc-dependent metalloprotease [Cesiribacter andamanensis]|uniref:Glutamyl-and glutaminyl-tRNA synthetase n=1 Tax=Cesiribacter andamanensis AMV16 TaxID=1279009 RepID=M7N9P6_9BACT|nr:zinc-dependent metalloprotease [Cesiribacter andamanensis]EMR03926.1 Glutamyl- and glutaminyl-tRNA synthetase [Cesiribacter andamanensis AMV16]